MGRELKIKLKPYSNRILFFMRAKLFSKKRNCQIKEKEMFLRYTLLVICLWKAQTANACEAYTPADPATCYQDYVSINAPDANTKKPLCFMTATFLHSSNEADWPCFTVSNTDGSGRHIEVLVELAQTGTICINSDQPGDQESCSSGGTASLCKTVPGGASSLSYKIYCAGSNCEVDQKFWYRIVVEEANVDTGNYDENWCAGRIVEFPSSLATLPPSGGITAPPPAVTSPTDGAGLVQYSKLTTVVLATAALLLIMMMR